MPLPPMRLFPDGGNSPVPRLSNAVLARDFLDLSFKLESGRALPVFSRFEGPITVALSGEAPATLVTDLDQLIGRLRREAGIDISRIAGPVANISVVTVTRAEMQRHVPQAACFVSPRISSWAEFTSGRNPELADWTTLRQREKMAIFIPWDVAPQEIRDCLHEELAQALGPLNDLYRLNNSVFNDDNFHAVLTGYDMLMLRLTYAPELRSGLPVQVVAARLPGLLARLNPGGGSADPARDDPTPRPWIAAIETAIGPSAGQRQRLAAARQAVQLAQSYGWQETRLGFSYYVLGRIALGVQPELSRLAFRQAEAVYAASPETRVQWSHVALQLAAEALIRYELDEALRLTGAAIPVARQSGNAALLAQLMLMQAEALEHSGRGSEAQSTRSEALGWARYGFGADAEVRNRAADIARLVPVPAQQDR